MGKPNFERSHPKPKSAASEADRWRCQEWRWKSTPSQARSIETSGDRDGLHPLSLSTCHRASTSASNYRLSQLMLTSTDYAYVVGEHCLACIPYAAFSSEHPVCRREETSRQTNSFPSQATDPRKCHPDTPFETRGCMSTPPPLSPPQTRSSIVMRFKCERGEQIWAVKRIRQGRTFKSE